MKGPGIKDYIDAILQMKEKAHNSGKKCIEINSKSLHERVSPNHATMPTCCQAIYKLMLEGDQILRRPRGQTGFGSHLDVRYYTDNLVNREPVFPPKKRGRPEKDIVEKMREERLRMNRTTDGLSDLVSTWLNERGWQSHREKDCIVAIKEDKKWIINIQGTKRGRKQPLPIKLNTVLKEIDDVNAQFSIAFNDSTQCRKQWQELPRLLKSKLQMSALLADKNGKIHEVK